MMTSGQAECDYSKAGDTFAYIRRLRVRDALTKLIGAGTPRAFVNSPSVGGDGTVTLV
jgi:hypothetical protein